MIKGHHINCGNESRWTNPVAQMLSMYPGFEDLRSWGVDDSWCGVSAHGVERELIDRASILNARIPDQEQKHLISPGSY